MYNSSLRRDTTLLYILTRDQPDILCRTPDYSLSTIWPPIGRLTLPVCPPCSFSPAIHSDPSIRLENFGRAEEGRYGVCGEGQDRFCGGDYDQSAGKLYDMVCGRCRAGRWMKDRSHEYGVERGIVVTCSNIRGGIH